MPIERNEDKIVINTGQGDVIFASARHEIDKEICIIILQGESGAIGRGFPELIGKKVDDWTIKIMIPSQESWTAIVDVFQQYAIEKWGEIPIIKDKK
jgi:hypothetical protein